MKILSLDLGKYKTVGCDYEGESGRLAAHRRGKAIAQVAHTLWLTNARHLRIRQPRLSRVRSTAIFIIRLTQILRHRESCPEDRRPTLELV